MKERKAKLNAKASVDKSSLEDENFGKYHNYKIQTNNKTYLLLVLHELGDLCAPV